MNQLLKSVSVFSIGVLIYILLGSSCLPKFSFSANGLVMGIPLATTVDSELAKKIIEDPNNKEVTNFFKKNDDKELNTATLAGLSKEYSLDVASLFFAKKHYSNPQNKIAQDIYQSSLKGPTSIHSLKSYHVVFVPGFAYKEDPSTGADFFRQRKLFDSLNISNELIETDEWGLSEVNAKLIADRLRELNAQYDKIILVTASKGGLESSIALGKILRPNEISSLKSWVSVGGILRGSPIADRYLKAPNCWLAKIQLWTKGKTIDIVKDISYSHRQKEFEKLSFPKHIKTIHFVGIPWSTHITKETKGRFCNMFELGPNDGITPIADEVTKHGIVISELGLDHYYRDENIDKKTLALAILASSR